MTRPAERATSVAARWKIISVASACEGHSLKKSLQKGATHHASEQGYFP